MISTAKNWQYCNTIWYTDAFLYSKLLCSDLLCFSVFSPILEAREDGKEEEAHDKNDANNNAEVDDMNKTSSR